MSNEVLFGGFLLFSALTTLGVYRYGGRAGLFAMIALSSVLMNIAVLKQFELFGLLITGGNILYGMIFLATDILSEQYGKKAGYQAVLYGFIASAVFVVFTQVLLLYIPAADDFAQDSLITLFTVTPRILVGSLVAFLIAQSLDVWLYHKIRKSTSGRFLWLRNNVSTLISQAVDTIIFTVVGLTSFAFLPIEGVIPAEYFWQVCIATYLIKAGIALLDTPFLYAAKRLSSTEHD